MKKLLTLQEKQYIENNILIAFQEFCDRHNLKFMLNWGTLLGAVRHKGFIPWDDDIDVVMTLSDYKTLCGLKGLFDDEMKKYHLKMQTPFDTTMGMYSWGCRIYDTRTSYVDTTGLFSAGICRDISFYKIAPTNKIACYLYGTKKRILFKLHCMKNNMENIPKKFYKRVIKKVIRPMFSCISEDYFYNKIIEQDMCENDTDSKYIWEPLAILANFPYEKIVWKREWFDENTKLEFNGRYYDVPLKYHEILSTHYGDYMVLPPHSERIQQHDHGGAYIKDGEHIEGL